MIRAPWTIYEDRVLSSYALAGKAARDAAKALPGRTRSAVIGRANRIGVVFDPLQSRIDQLCVEGTRERDARRVARGKA